MVRRALLEVIVESVEDARAAARGGADRLEIVRDLARGGLTPDVALVRAITAEVPVPARVMVRVEEPFVPSAPGIVTQLASDARAFADTGVEGIVVGVLDGDGRVDVDAVGRVLAEVVRLRATFHRAFEVVRDPAEALAALRGLPQVDTVLVNGGEGRWVDRHRRIDDLARAAAPGLRILAAIGTDPEPLARLDPSWPFDVHVGRAAREPQDVRAPVSENKVRALARQLAP
jgi:copper homeostasis protein